MVILKSAPLLTGVLSNPIDNDLQVGVVAPVRVEPQLGKFESQNILVAIDCLSEGGHRLAEVDAVPSLFVEGQSHARLIAAAVFDQEDQNRVPLLLRILNQLLFEVFVILVLEIVRLIVSQLLCPLLLINWLILVSVTLLSILVFVPGHFGIWGRHLYLIALVFRLFEHVYCGVLLHTGNRVFGVDRLLVVHWFCGLLVV